MAEKTKDLPSRVREWIETEGYPLEFYTANAFREAGFLVTQGYYAIEPKTQTPREVDVLAAYTSESAHEKISIHQVVECKYITHRPWVIFTSTNHQWSPEWIARWTIAGEVAGIRLKNHRKELGALNIFQCPTRWGHGGRETFSKTNHGDPDAVYRAIQSVIANAAVIVQTDKGSTPPGQKRMLDIAFPMIVVEGRLFEASMMSTAELQVEEVKSSRVFWRGANSTLLATVDVVVKDELEAFLPRRRSEAEELAQAVLKTLGAASEIKD